MAELKFKIKDAQSWIVSGLMGFLYLCVLWPLLAESPQDADSSEFVYAAVSGGAVHAPGYPWFSWLCEKTYQIAGGNVYHTLAVLNAVMQSIAVILLAFVCIQLSQNLWMGIAFSSAWALASSTMYGATFIEVFSTHHVVQIFLYLICFYFIALSKNENTWVNTPKKKIFISLSVGLVCGIGGSHQQIIVLSAPIVLYFWWVWSDNFKDKLKHGLLINAGAIIGLLPYLHLFQRDQKEIRYGIAYVDTFDRLVSHILRAQYGTFSFAYNEHSQSAFDLYTESSWIFLPLGIICVFFILQIVQSVTLVSLNVVKLCGVLFLNVGLGLLFLSQIGSHNSLILERFFPTTWIPLTLMSSLCYKSMVNIFKYKKPYYEYLLLCVMVFFVFHDLSSTLRKADAHVDTIKSEIIDGIEQSLPPNSVLIVEGDEISFAIQAAQVQGRLKDIHVYNPGIANLGWVFDRWKYYNHELLKMEFYNIENKSEQNINKETLIRELLRTSKRVLSIPGTQGLFKFDERIRLIPVGILNEVVFAEDTDFKKRDQGLLSRCLLIPSLIQEFPPERKTSVDLIYGFYFTSFKDRAHETDDLAKYFNNIYTLLLNGEIDNAKKHCLALSKKQII